MPQNDLDTRSLAILIAVALGVSIPAGGLAVAIADGHVIIPHLLSEGLIAVFVAGGGITVTAGAIYGASRIPKKRGSTFIALCACGDWFIADSIGDLYLAGHSDLEKNLFKFCASVAFALAAGLWSKASEPLNTSRFGFRCAAIVLFAIPTLLVALRLYFFGAEFTFHGAKLIVLLVAPAALALFYIGVFAMGVVKDK